MEIHAGEGGIDSKLFVYDLMAAYVKYARRNGLKVDILASEPSFSILSIEGKDASKYFENEPGKHCVQRIPPSERNGRVHTSIISVAVLEVPKDNIFDIAESDLEIQFTKGSGPGGQKRNVTSSAVRIVHKPTGMRVFICTERSQHQNKRLAFEILSAKVKQANSQKQQAGYDKTRHDQLGNRGRGEKIRTYNLRDSRVVDHRLGTKTTRVDEIMDGHFELILR